MKLLFLNNTDADFTEPIKSMTDYFAQHKVILEVTVQKVTIPISTTIYKTTQGFNGQTGKPQIVSWLGLAQSVKDACVPYVQNHDFIMLSWDIGTVINPDVVYSNWTDLQTVQGARFMQLVYNPYLLSSGEVSIALKHEPMHALCYNANAKGFAVHDYMDMDTLGRPFYLNATPDNPTSNFSQTWAQLAPFINSLNNTHMWKYFKSTEQTGGGHTVAELKTELVDLLDKARDIAGVAFKGTSGFRTITENISVGGKPDSSHLTGEALDLACSDSMNRWKIVNALIKVGFTRIEIAKDHIHCDVSKTLPQNILDFSNLS